MKKEKKKTDLNHKEKSNVKYNRVWYKCTECGKKYLINIPTAYSNYGWNVFSLIFFVIFGGGVFARNNPPLYCPRCGGKLKEL